MRLEQRQSGILVPTAPPAPPRRRYGAIEVRDEDRREIVKQVMLSLWDALDLSSGGLRIPGESSGEALEAYQSLYYFVGHLLLGAECPEREVFT